MVWLLDSRKPCLCFSFFSWVESGFDILWKFATLVLFIFSWLPRFAGQCSLLLRRSRTWILWLGSSRLMMNLQRGCGRTWRVWFRLVRSVAFSFPFSRHCQVAWVQCLRRVFGEETVCWSCSLMLRPGECSSRTHLSHYNRYWYWY